MAVQYALASLIGMVLGTAAAWHHLGWWALLIGQIVGGGIVLVGATVFPKRPVRLDGWSRYPDDK